MERENYTVENIFNRTNCFFLSIREKVLYLHPRLGISLKLRYIAGWSSW